MLTSKERAKLRSQANTLPVTLTVGKGGVTAQVIAEADTVLTAKELVKGQVLESALLTARQACDAICEATGADGVQTIGSKFVLYRFSEKQEAKPRPKKVNPVRAGAQARRRKAREAREARNEYFRKAAVQAAIDARKK